MEWWSGLLDLAVRALQVGVGLVLAYGAYLACRHADVLTLPRKAAKVAALKAGYLARGVSSGSNSNVSEFISFSAHRVSPSDKPSCQARTTASSQ